MSYGHLESRVANERSKSSSLESELAVLNKKWDANFGHSRVLAERIFELERMLNITTEEKDSHLASVDQMKGDYESILKEKESILSEKDLGLQDKESEKESEEGSLTSRLFGWQTELKRRMLKRRRKLERLPQRETKLRRMQIMLPRRKMK